MRISAVLIAIVLLVAGYFLFVSNWRGRGSNGRPRQPFSRAWGAKSSRGGCQRFSPHSGILYSYQRLYDLREGERCNRGGQSEPER